MIQIDINMPIGCIYEGDNGKTEYCPLCNHDDVPYCQYLDDDEAALGIDERPCYCPLYKSESQWIPCSERLPEEETDVLVTRTFLGCKDSSHGWNNHIPPKTYVEVAQYFNGEWTALSDEYKVARNRHTDPIAWMPLPAPWEEGEE